MRIRYCPNCKKAGLKLEDDNNRGCDGLTDYERYHSTVYIRRDEALRWCTRCKEWVKADVGSNLSQHKK